jgi:hypothetical protein
MAAEAEAEGPSLAARLCGSGGSGPAVEPAAGSVLPVWGASGPAGWRRAVDAGDGAAAVVGLAGVAGWLGGAAWALTLALACAAALPL